MPRAFLIKNKRGRVDSIAEELFARREIANTGGMDDDLSRSMYDLQHDDQWTDREHGLRALHEAAERRMKGVPNPIEMMAYSAHARAHLPPPLLRMSSGSAFEKVYPGALPPDHFRVAGMPHPTRAGPHQRVLFNPWLEYPDAASQNILRDRLLSHPATGYLLADPRHPMFALPPGAYPPQRQDEPLDLKIRSSSEREDDKTDAARSSQRQCFGGTFPLKKRALSLDHPGAPSLREDHRESPYLSAALHPSVYPLIGLPYGHAFSHKYLNSFGHRSSDPADKYPHSLSGHSPIKSKEHMSPPLSSPSDKDSPLARDPEQPPICSVKPSFNGHPDSKDSLQSPLSPYQGQSTLRQPHYAMSKLSSDEETSGAESSREGSPLPHTSKRPTRQPILGVEYIENSIDNEMRENPEDVDIVKTEPMEVLTPKQLYQVHGGSSSAPETGAEDGRDLVDGTATEPIMPPCPEVKGRRANSAKTPQPRKYICDVCGKGFSRSNTLVTHKRIHTGDKPFACELCGRAFRQPGNLTRHRLTHTTVKPYVCSQCGKAFNRASNLHTHMRTHTNYKPFVCQYCGKGFHQKIDMKIHSYTHTGEKPHKCKKCGRGFKQLTHLTYHMRTHSEVKMYTCAYCGKGFNQKGNLQAHIYRHTGERPYRCEVCNKGFTLASTLNTHRRTHAEKKPFGCQYCGKDFYQRNALKSHLLASHPYTGGESLL